MCSTAWQGLAGCQGAAHLGEAVLGTADRDLLHPLSETAGEDHPVVEIGDELFPSPPDRAGPDDVTRHCPSSVW